MRTGRSALPSHSDLAVLLIELFLCSHRTIADVVSSALQRIDGILRTTTFAPPLYAGGQPKPSLQEQQQPRKFAESIFWHPTSDKPVVYNYEVAGEAPLVVNRLAQPPVKVSYEWAKSGGVCSGADRPAAGEPAVVPESKPPLAPSAVSAVCTGIQFHSNLSPSKDGYKRQHRNAFIHAHRKLAGGHVTSADSESPLSVSESAKDSRETSPHSSAPPHASNETEKDASPSVSLARSKEAKTVKQREAEAIARYVQKQNDIRVKRAEVRK